MINFIKNRYNLYKIKKILNSVANSVFDRVWEKYKDSGYTKKQVIDAVMTSMLKVLNERDPDGNWLVLKEDSEES